MSDPQNSSTSILQERLRLGAGFTTGDQGQVLEILSPAATWPIGAPSGWISRLLKNRGGPEQKVTLEAGRPGGRRSSPPRLTASSTVR